MSKKPYERASRAPLIKPNDHLVEPETNNPNKKFEENFLTIAFILTILIVIFLIYFLTWTALVVSVVPKFQVDDVTLAEFTLAPNMTLYYNLDVNMTFRNPSSQVGIHYDNIKVNAMYQGQRLMTKQVPGFYQGYKENNNVSAVFRGERLLVLDNGDEKWLYESESKDGVYDIELKLIFKMRTRALLQNSDKFHSKAVCDLKVQLSSLPSAKFERTKCSYKKPK